MKVINVLTTLALVCLPTIAIANNLPFVGKRDFHSIYFDGDRGWKQIQINKNGSVKVYSIRLGRTDDNKEYSARYLLYQGRYKHVMSLSGHSDGEHIMILNKNQIAYTDKQGNILDDCGMDEKAYCIDDLTKVR